MPAALVGGRPRWRLGLGSLLIQFGLAAGSGAETYYVAAVGGSNGNPGSIDQPWATLQHAADTVGPGDTVLVRGGDHAGFQIGTDGTPTQRITFAAYPGEIPNIVSNGGHLSGIDIEGAQYVTVQGFRVAGR